MATDSESRFVAAVVGATEQAALFDAAAALASASKFEQPNTQLRALIEGGAKSEAVAQRWLGADAAEQALVAQWLSLKQAEAAAGWTAGLVDVDAALATKGFLVTSERPTLADLSVFWAVRPHVSAETAGVRTSLCRWFDQMQHSQAVRSALGPELKLVNFEFPDVRATVVAKAEPKATGDAGAKAASKRPPAPGSPAAKEAAAKTKDAKGKDAKGKDAKGKDAKGGDAAKHPEAPQKQGKQGKEKKAKQPKAKKAPPAPTNQPAVTKLDIRVGRVTKCWAHEDSDKLYCEEIELGEEKPRQIASGLRAFYADASQIEGRLVLVLVNLKPRNLGGFPSNGMVLCASNADHTAVELIDPPAGAKIGEKVEFPSIAAPAPAGDAKDGEAAAPEEFKPFTPSAMNKKKVMEAVMPNLKTSDAKVACWLDADGNQHPFQTSAGPCTAPSLAGAAVA